MEYSKWENNGKRILCVGSINMDLTMFMERMPAPAETVITDNFATYPGGKGGNQAVAAARMGGNVGFLGKLAQTALAISFWKNSAGTDRHLAYPD